MMELEDLRQTINLHETIRSRLVHFQTAIGLKLALVYLEKVRCRRKWIFSVWGTGWSWKYTVNKKTKITIT